MGVGQAAARFPRIWVVLRLEQQKDHLKTQSTDKTKAFASLVLYLRYRDLVAAVEKPDMEASPDNVVKT
jgi:hypothetical protein